MARTWGATRPGSGPSHTSAGAFTAHFLVIAALLPVERRPLERGAESYPPACTVRHVGLALAYPAAVTPVTAASVTGHGVTAFAAASHPAPSRSDNPPPHGNRAPLSCQPRYAAQPFDPMRPRGHPPRPAAGRVGCELPVGSMSANRANPSRSPATAAKWFAWAVALPCSRNMYAPGTNPVAAARASIWVFASAQYGFV